MQEADKLGYEFLLERKVEAKEILKVVRLPQVVGWRYSPQSHQKDTLCACPICISPGEINSRKKREKIELPLRIPAYVEIVERLSTEQNEQEIDTLFWYLRRKPRKADPMALAFLLTENKSSTLELLALTLPTFKHPSAFAMLASLCCHSSETVRKYSAEGLLEIDKVKALAWLEPLATDVVIKEVINEHIE